MMKKVGNSLIKNKFQAQFIAWNFFINEDISILHIKQSLFFI